MQHERPEECMESRRSLWICLISIAGGAILAWLGYGSLDTDIGKSLFDAANEPAGYWPLVITILGTALLVSGVTGILRGK